MNKFSLLALLPIAAAGLSLRGGVETCLLPDHGDQCELNEYCLVPAGDCRKMISNLAGTCVVMPAESDCAEEEIAPVCGCDEATYANECQAAGAGTNLSHLGKCTESGARNTDEPTPEPTPSPTPSPIDETPEPTPSPTPSPIDEPTEEPTPSPIPSPTDEPTISPTPSPTGEPTHEPTPSPTPIPTNEPTPAPVLPSEPTEAAVSCIFPDGDQCSEVEYCSVPDGNCQLKIAQQDGTCDEKPQLCPMNIDYVCGCDLVTYSNACHAANAGVNVMETGECPASSPSLYGFSQVGEGKCADRNGNDYQAVLFTNVRSLISCQERCLQNTGDGIVVNSALVGLEYYSDGTDICWCDYTGDKMPCPADGACYLPTSSTFGMSRADTTVLDGVQACYRNENFVGIFARPGFASHTNTGNSDVGRTSIRVLDNDTLDVGNVEVNGELRVFDLISREVDAAGDTVGSRGFCEMSPDGRSITYGIGNIEFAGTTSCQYRAIRGEDESTVSPYTLVTIYVSLTNDVALVVQNGRENSKLLSAS